MSQLGRIYPTIHIGDSLTFLRVMQAESIDLICTDPPYNIPIADWDDLGGSTDRERGIALANFLAPYFAEFRRVLKPTGSVFVFMAEGRAQRVDVALEDSGLVRQRDIIANRTNGSHRWLFKDLRRLRKSCAIVTRSLS